MTVTSRATMNAATEEMANVAQASLETGSTPPRSPLGMGVGAIAAVSERDRGWRGTLMTRPEAALPHPAHRQYCNTLSRAAMEVAVVVAQPA